MKAGVIIWTAMAVAGATAAISGNIEHIYFYCCPVKIK